MAGYGRWSLRAETDKRPDGAQSRGADWPLGAWREAGTPLLWWRIAGAYKTEEVSDPGGSE